MRNYTHLNPFYKLCLRSLSNYRIFIGNRNGTLSKFKRFFLVNNEINFAYNSNIWPMLSILFQLIDYPRKRDEILYNLPCLCRETWAKIHKSEGLRCIDHSLRATAASAVSFTTCLEASLSHLLELNELRCLIVILFNRDVQKRGLLPKCTNQKQPRIRFQ